MPTYQNINLQAPVCHHNTRAIRARRPTYAYDNTVHARIARPPPACPISDTERSRLADLLDKLKKHPGRVMVYPWTRHLTAPSEAAAIVLSRMIYWFSPAENLRQGRTLPRGRHYDDTGMPGYHSANLPSDTGLPVRTVQAAIAALARPPGDTEPLIYLDLLPDGRRARPNAPALAAAYYHATNDTATLDEYPGDGSGPDWHDSQTACRAVKRVTVLHPDLLDLIRVSAITKGKPQKKDQVFLLAARALHQILYMFNSVKLVQGWLRLTVRNLGRSLGVGEEAAGVALDTLVRAGLLHRAKWRGRQRSERTLLAPAITRIISALEVPEP